MYKTKLQELCHKRRWGLPKYSAMKDGPDHMPSFKASVYVNRVTFTCPRTFSSCKEARNQAAMLAFLSFSSPAPAGSSTPIAECDIKEQIESEKPHGVPLPADFSVIINDMDHLGKSKLQNYARRNNLDPPIFTAKTEGPPHAARFKAKVIVDGQSFESPAFYNTIKEAKQAAAKVALTSLSLDIFDRESVLITAAVGDFCSFKNLLLELTRREGYCKPTYRTLESGSPHMPTFFSTVEVGGKEFHGNASKSKKRAEQDAAKIAFIALKECGFDVNSAFPSTHFIENKVAQSIHSSDTVNSKQNLKHEGLFLLSSAQNKDELKEQDLNELHNPSFLQPPEENMVSNGGFSSCESVSVSSPKSSPFSQLHLSSLSNSKLNKAKTTEKSNYLLCNRFKVYTCFPKIAFPEGIIVLPIGDSKWVAVSLEFPMTKCR